MTDGDATARRASAHKPKGAIQHFGLDETPEQAFRREETGQEGSLADAEAVPAALEAGLKRLLPALAAYVRRRATADQDVAGQRNPWIPSISTSPDR